MAEFRLNDVAKKAEISVEEAIQKLEDAGEPVLDSNANVSVEQMRILGIDPQQILDKRKEILRLALERRNRGTIGKEIIMSFRGKEETASVPSRKISKEELQKRKSELNKDVRKVDEARRTVSRQKEETQQLTTNAETEKNERQITQITEPPVETPPKKTETKVVDQDASKSAVPETINKEPVNKQNIAKSGIAPKFSGQPTPRPLGPAGHFPNDHRAGVQRRPTSPDYRQKTQSGQIYRPPEGKRPTGPAAGNRYGISGRQTGYTPQDERKRTSAPPIRTSGVSGAKRPESTPAHEDERRVRESKKFKTTEPTTVKEEIKKAKTKVEAKKTKDWTKTISEGISELDIEHEVDSAEVPSEKEDTPAPAVVFQSVFSGKSERKGKRKPERELPPPTPKPTVINIGEQVVVSELAGMIGIKAAELVKKLFSMGIIATINQAIDADSAALLCIDYGIEVRKKVVTEGDLLPEYKDDESRMQRRPPVVTVMGHVDHGKTSLLDAIRSTSVAEKEAGGITQHIGAYEVDLNGRKITFLDTPGHEAFTTLRARGAQATDIVILVVAANDGVMPQTKEAIDHAKAAGVRLIVAINKIDRQDANVDKVRQQLADYGIISDEWGGENQFQEISAKKRVGIEDLLERALLEADILELKGNPNRPAEGIVIESQLDKQKGPVATVLVKKGTLRRGDTFIVGSQVGKVRSMYNYRGVVVKEAPISMPVEVMGFSNVPEAGDALIVVEDEKVAKIIADLRLNKEKTARQIPSAAVSLSDFYNKIKEGQVKELSIIIKADVQDSLEALRSSLQKLSNVEVKINIVHDATGAITESDVVLAVASKAIIIGFNVRPDAKARSMAEKDGISIELYSIIYKVIEDVKLAMEGLLAPEVRENIIGRVEIRQIFSVPKIGKIAGSHVLEGKVTRVSQVRVIRDNVVIYDGKLASLKRFADDVKEVAHGYECGLSIERYQDIKEKDVLEVYELINEKRTLDDVKPL